MIVERLHRVLVRVQPRMLPKSLLGEAIAYALGQWPTLTVYLDEGRVEIDNSLVENAIRPTALGKKNWLFVGADTAGDRSPILYTVIESCRRRGLDPYAYLRDVLTRLPAADQPPGAGIHPRQPGQIPSRFPLPHGIDVIVLHYHIYARNGGSG
jgi:transposase